MPAVRTAAQALFSSREFIGEDDLGKARERTGSI
jgi:hypothetical protein